MGTWSPITAPGRGKPRYGAVRSGLPAEAKYSTCTPGTDGIDDGRRTELVAKTSVRTSGTWPSSATIAATPLSSASWLLFHQATRGSMSKTIVRTDSSLARASTPERSVSRS